MLLTISAFDESYHYTNNNGVYSILLGDALEASDINTSDDTAYNHYSQMATVEQNWDLGDLGLGDSTAAAFF